MTPVGGLEGEGRVGGGRLALEGGQLPHKVYVIQTNNRQNVSSHKRLHLSYVPFFHESVIKEKTSGSSRYDKPNLALTS